MLCKSIFSFKASPVVSLSLIFLLMGTVYAYAQSPKIIKWNELEQYITSPSDKPVLLNFWATWCKPCVQELPYFLEVADSMKNEMEVVLISMDFSSEVQRKVIPFMDRKQIRIPVWLLDETDYNSFIDKVDPAWSGAIPATLLLSQNRNSRAFFEKEYHNSLELTQDIRTFIQSIK